MAREGRRQFPFLTDRSGERISSGDVKSRGVKQSVVGGATYSRRGRRTPAGLPDGVFGTAPLSSRVRSGPVGLGGAPAVQVKVRGKRYSFVGTPY